MSFSEDDQYFEFTWTIENFSMIRRKPDQPLSSPKFMVHFLKGSEWFLQLYPQGLKDAKNIMCHLHRTHIGPEQIDVKYSIAIEDSDCEVRQVFKKNSMSDKLVKIDRDRYYNELKDTECEGDLKVVCRLKSSQVDDDPGKVKPCPVRCSARSIVPVEKRKLVWSISNFASLPSQHEISTSVVSSSSSSSKLLVTLSWSDENLKGGGGLKMEVREMPEYVGKTFRLGCRIRMLNAKDEYVKLARGWYLFTSVQKNYLLWMTTYSDSVWNFELDIDRSDLYQKRDVLLKNGELVLECDFAISYDPLSCIFEETGFVHPKPVSPPVDEPEVIPDHGDDSWKALLLREFNDQNALFKFFVTLFVVLAVISRLFQERMPPV